MLQMVWFWLQIYLLVCELSYLSSSHFIVTHSGLYLVKRPTIITTFKNPKVNKHHF